MIKNKRQVSPTLDGIRDDHVKRYQFAGLECMKRNMTGPVLDIGCGSGYGSYILAQCGLTVYGIDIDPGAVEYGNQHYRHEKIVRWPGEMATFDWKDRAQAVVAFEVIEHSKDAPAFLSQASKHCRLLIGSVPNEEVVPFGGPNIHTQHYRHYTPQELSIALSNAGWRTVFMGSQIGKRGAQARIESSTRGRTLVFVAEPMS